MSRLLVVATLLFSPAEADDSDRVAALTKAMNHGSDKARVEAARELGRVGGKQVIAVLTQALDAENETLRHAVALALVTSGSKESDVVAVLRTSLRAEAWYRRWGALRALTLIGRTARSAVPDLIHVYESKDPILRREAALALAQIAPDVSALLNSLDRGHPDGGAGLAALKASGYKASAVLLWVVQRIKGSQTGAQDHDFDLLAALGLHLAVYLELLDRESPRVRAAALAALRKLGPRARGAIPAVCAWFVSPNKSEREDARATLRAIGASSLCDLICADPWGTHLWPRVLREKKACLQLVGVLEDKRIGEQTRREIAKLHLLERDQGLLASMVTGNEKDHTVHCALLLLPLFADDLKSAETVARKIANHESAAVRRAAQDALLRIERQKKAKVR